MVKAIVLSIGFFAASLAHGETETIGALRDRLGRLEIEHAKLQQENQTMMTQMQVLETRKRLKIAQEDIGVLPLVVSLSRLDEKWSARLQLSGGVINTFAVGDVPQSGVRIADISASGVKVEVGSGKSIRQAHLAFVTPAPTVAGAPGAAGMPMPAPLPR